MKQKEVNAHMMAAYVYAELSSCERRQVGCVLVKDDSIIAIGYNGTPSGDCNCCEDADGITKDSVIHAEDNALRKLTRRYETSVGCTVFITTAPCIKCAEKLTSAQVSAVYFNEPYNNLSGVKYLKDHNVSVYQTRITPPVYS